MTSQNRESSPPVGSPAISFNTFKTISLTPQLLRQMATKDPLPLCLSRNDLLM
jgi:hypothetical protein